MNAIVNSEYELADEVTQTKKKKKKNQDEKTEYNEYDALNARLKLRRGLLNLYLSLSQKFSPQKRDQISNNINFCQKNLELVKETIQHSADASSYMVEELPKTLMCHLPPRKFQQTKITETLEIIAKMLAHLNQILELTQITSFYAIQHKLDALSKQNMNLLARAYLDVNLFQGTGKYFHYYEISDIVQVQFTNTSTFCLIACIYREF